MAKIYGVRDCERCGGEYEAKAANAKHCRRIECVKARNKASTEGQYARRKASGKTARRRYR